MPDPITAPSAAPKAAAPAEGQPKIPGSRTDVQTRIDELAAQKAHFQKQAQQYRSELDQVKQEIAFLKGKESTAPAAPTAAPESWEQMTPAQLEDAKRWGRENERPETIDAVYKEQTRRAAAEAGRQALVEAKKSYQQDQLIRDTHARIVREFGPDALDPNSALYQAADQHLAADVARYGKDTVANDPAKLHYAFLLAEREVRTTQERQRLGQLEKDHAALQQRATLLERGGLPGSFAAPPNDAVKAALAKNDRRGAIKALGLFRSLSSQAKADALATPR